MCFLWCLHVLGVFSTFPLLLQRSNRRIKSIRVMLCLFQVFCLFTSLVVLSICHRQFSNVQFVTFLFSFCSFLLLLWLRVCGRLCLVCKFPYGFMDVFSIVGLLHFSRFLKKFAGILWVILLNHSQK